MRSLDNLTVWLYEVSDNLTVWLYEVLDSLTVRQAGWGNWVSDNLTVC